MRLVAERSRLRGGRPAGSRPGPIPPRLQGGDPRDETEPQAAATPGAARIQSDEALQHALPLLRRNARPRILHREPDGARGMVRKAHPDPVFGRVRQRVVEQIGDELGEELAVTGDLACLLQLSLDGEALLFGRGGA